MTEFNVGDKVRFKKNFWDNEQYELDGFGTTDGVYTITEIDEDIAYIRDDNGTKWDGFLARFDLVEAFTSTVTIERQLAGGEFTTVVFTDEDNDQLTIAQVGAWLVFEINGEMVAIPRKDADRLIDEIKRIA